MWMTDQNTNTSIIIYIYDIYHTYTHTHTYVKHALKGETVRTKGEGKEENRK
jgi:hypothetical protein